LAVRTIEPGEVFAVPVDDARQALGQVVGEYMSGAFHVVIFDGLFDRSSPPAPDQVIDSPVSLVALSLDAKLLNGDWPVIGRESVDREPPLPLYKEEVPGGTEVVDWTGTRRRRAAIGEADQFGYREVVSPALLELAVKAKHGLADWHEAFDALMPRPTPAGLDARAD
jgi:hypothetical protein